LIQLLFFRLKTFLNYCLKRQEKHGVHSPYVFDLMTIHLPSKKEFNCFENIEYLREQMLNSSLLVEIEDFGAGSVKGSSKIRKISEITSVSSKPQKQAQLFFRLANLHQPKTILELGTNLGLTTAYLSLACPHAKTISIEGSRELALIARQNLHSLGSSAEVRVGIFDELLDPVLEELGMVGLAFIDGNHRKDATITYWGKIKSRCNSDSIVIVDDIYWSPEMNQAWKVIKSDKLVSLSLDFYWFGLVYFRHSIEKQEFTLKIPQ
jgi:predicted O-methyltransferase YrrM